MPKLNTYPLQGEFAEFAQLFGLIPGTGDEFETIRISRDAFVNLIKAEAITIKGDKGDNGKQVELFKTATHIVWRYVGDLEWIDLVALIDLKGDAGTGLTNRGVWAAGTFNPGDYVFATGSIGSGNAMWVLSDSAPYASSVQPKDDPTHWIEQAAPAGPAGDDGLSVELQKSATHIQWRQTGGSWADLVPLADLVGAQGTSGANGKTVLTTTGAPSASTGTDGDFAYDPAAMTMYGPKAAGAWPAGVILKGSAGTAGAAGAKWHTGTDVPAAGTGANGDFYLRSNGDYYGPKASGAWGAVVGSLKGSVGDAGSDYSLTFIDKGTGAVASTQTFDVAAGAVQRLQVEGALTVAFINWKPAGQLSELLIELVNGASAVITGLNGIRWIKSDGSYTTTFADSGVSLQTSGTDWVFLWTRDGGTTIWGKVVR